MVSVTGGGQAYQMIFNIISEVKRDFVLSLLDEGKRIDGREFLEYRDIEIQTGVIGKAEGSARVRLGNTQVLVGVKADVGSPFPDTPTSGVLTVNAELLPLASPTFEPGPPDENAIELARVVDRGLRESGAIDLESLCLIEGEKVWVIFVDIHILDHDGNLIDASALGAIAALLDAKIPRVEITEDGQVIKSEEEFTRLPIKTIPISQTFAKIGKHIVLDPCFDEELVMDARFTVTFHDGLISAMQKGGPGTFTFEEIESMIDFARENYGKLKEKLLEAVGGWEGEQRR